MQDAVSSIKMKSGPELEESQLSIPRTNIFEVTADIHVSLPSFYVVSAFVWIYPGVDTIIIIRSCYLHVVGTAADDAAVTSSMIEIHILLHTADCSFILFIILQYYQYGWSYNINVGTYLDSSSESSSID